MFARLQVMYGALPPCQSSIGLAIYEMKITVAMEIGGENGLCGRPVDRAAPLGYTGQIYGEASSNVSRQSPPPRKLQARGAGNAPIDQWPARRLRRKRQRKR